MEFLSTTEKQRLNDILYQCDMHQKRINYAINKMNSFMTLTPEKYDYLSDEEIEHIDMLIFRFSKLQDTMGNKLFPMLLKSLGEDIKPMSFIDRLNRLEELGFCKTIEWLNLREIRNNIAHEYFSNKYQIVDSINELYNNINTIFNIYEKIKGYLKSL